MRIVYDTVRQLTAKAGLFLARKFPNTVNGYVLGDDLRQLIPQPEPVCFDIGANQGQTIDLLRGCLSSPIIHAFEPASATFSKLIQRPPHSTIHLHQLALGDRVGTAEFRNYAQSELSSFLPINPDGTDNLFHREALLSTEAVRVETLDTFCRDHGIDRIDLLKIDTQGYELPVLRGAAQLFAQRKIGAVLLELNFAPLYEKQSDALAVMALLREHNLRLVDFYEKERASGRELSWTTALFIHRA